MRLLITIILLFVPMLGISSTVSVGGQNINIPTPIGYVKITPNMSELYEMQQLIVHPANELLIAFMPEELIPQVLQGEIPEIERKFSVQTAKSVSGKVLLSTDFQRLKAKIKSENDEFIGKVEGRVPNLIEKLNKEFSEKYNIDLALSLSQVVPLPIHEETEHTLAYSAFSKYVMNDELGRPTIIVSVATITMIHVNGNLLFLYSSGGENDLKWTREASRSWVERLFSENS